MDLPGRDGAVVEFRFHYDFPDALSKDFVVRLDKSTLALVGWKRGRLPSWTALPYKQCSNCPLKGERHCPVAANLAGLVALLKDRPSGGDVRSSITSAAGTLTRTTVLSRAFAPLFKLLMLTSGCPVLDRVRPAAFSAFPLVETTATIYELAATYLLEQFVRKEGGQEPDFGMRDFPALMKDLMIVSGSLIKRLSGVCRQDGAVNAIISLAAIAGLAEIDGRRRLADFSPAFFAGLSPKPASESGDNPKSRT